MSTAVNGPRVNKSGRTQTYRIVDGARLERCGPDAWHLGDFGFAYDEHLGWYLHRLDGEPTWWGSSTGAALIPELQQCTFARTLRNGVKYLRELGWIPADGRRLHWNIHPHQLAYCGPYRQEQAA